MLGGKKQQFYVQFLGWVETNGLRGNRYTDPVVNDLRRKAKKWKFAPKLTLQVGKKEMKITQDIQDERKKGKTIKTIKFPIIPSRDITYATQAATPDDDVVACIYLGYVPRTQRYVHVHVYRFDSPDTARTFVRFLNDIISVNAVRTDQIERQLVEQGHIEDFRQRSMPPVAHRPQPNMSFRFDSSDGMSDRAFHDDSGADSASFSDDGFPSAGSDEIEPDLQSLKDAVPFDSVTDELKARLKLTETQGAAPLLLPPKDYDTIVRRHGDLEKAGKRKCLQIPIVGGRMRNGSDESGIEVPSPTSSEGRQNSMDMSDDKISSSIHSGSNGLPTPPLSPRSGRDVYPGKPHVSRQNSSSGVSNRSSGVSTPDHSRASFYHGHITDIPPADYDDNETPILRQKTGMYSHRDLTKSMPTTALQREMDYGYAISPKRLNRSSARYNEPQYSPRVDMDYVRRPEGPTGVRRHNSMYR